MRGAHSQGETLDELNHNLKEVVELLLEDGEPELETEFVGTLKCCRGLTMGSLAVLKPTEVITILEHLGFLEARQKGSHKQFRHSDGRGTTVP